MTNEIEKLAAMPDSAIDTSDIPEVTDWSKAERGKFYRKPVVPEREPLTIGNVIGILLNEGISLKADAATTKRIVRDLNAILLAAAPRAAGGQREASLKLKQILDVLYTGRTMVNFSHVPEVTRAIDWLSQDFRVALAVAEPQVEERGKT